MSHHSSKKTKMAAGWFCKQGDVDSERTTGATNKITGAAYKYARFDNLSTYFAVTVLY